MDKYFTLMIIPEREKGVRSFRIPRMLFHAIVFITVISLFLITILSYDYWKILRQVYENKHLTIENRQLKEQIQLFQMKINTLSDDLERIYTFEKKLRVITGIDDVDMSTAIKKDNYNYNNNYNNNDSSSIETTKEATEAKEESKEDDGKNKINKINKQTSLRPFNIPQDIENEKDFINLKNLYEQKIATSFGLQKGYAYTKKWSELTKQSFGLAKQYATFDYQFTFVKNYIQELEVDIHELDQFLLDRDSFIKSLPTPLPCKGWITSYFKHRQSPYSGRLTMHEGLDIGASIGTSILAPADGIVSLSGTKVGFGIVVSLDHGYGIETLFAHAQSSNVKSGQRIKRGDLIAKVGNTGYSTGPHLHYEIRVNGVPVDPLYFVLD